MHGDTEMRVLMSNEMPKLVSIACRTWGKMAGRAPTPRVATTCWACAVAKQAGDSRAPFIITRALHGRAHPWMGSVSTFRNPKDRCFSTSAIAGWQQDGSGTTATASVPSPPITCPGFDPQHDRVGVVLLNLGGPDTLDDVRPFLYNLFADPEIIRLPPLITWLQPAIAFAISSSRARKSREGYAAIGGGSPLRRITEEQAAALANALRKAGVPADVTVAMRYWHPTSEQALAELKKKGINKLVVLPLYPQYSLSTSGSSLRLLRKLIAADPMLCALRTTVVPSWFGRRGYVSACADLIQQELQKLPETDSIHIFFSAHGVPVKYVAQGDPYQAETERCVELIMAELRGRGVTNQHILAYQSRVGPLEWLKPYTDAAIRELGSQGVRGLLAVPISFVSEHIETLEEMDVEYRDLAKSSGMEIWGRVPALNTYPPFIDDLADAVIEALPQTDQAWKKTVEPLAPSGTVVATDLDTAADYRLPAKQSTSQSSKDHSYFWRALKDLATFGGGGSYLK